jgi:hypothetical protein
MGSYGQTYDCKALSFGEG